MSQTGLWGTGAPDDPLEYGRRTIDVAVRRYNPVAVFGMFSGGHDSLCATHLASQHPSFTAAVHINTGIGIPQTRHFVRDTCKDQGWELLEYCAKEAGQDYEEIVCEYGFPGPAQHLPMYTRLKERALRLLIADHKIKWRDRVLLITGVRLAESTRRMGSTQTINREGAKVWVAPMKWWTARHKHKYMEDYNLPRNEVVDLLHMSGECLCGAFAKPGEKEWIRQWYPSVAERIDRIEKHVAQDGKHCVWGTRPPSGTDPRQVVPGPLCTDCGHRGGD